MEFILASASERRAELLKRLIDNYDIVVSNFDEGSVKFADDFGDYVEKLSMGKAFSVLKNVEKDCIIIACDTIVAYNDEVLGKPVDKYDAVNMLKLLSGNVHNVYSGITVIDSVSGRTISDHVRTEVKFSELTEKEINKYVETGEPMDKAGAYGIQGLGGVFVESINGCYYNVVGLPLNKLKFMLRGMGVNL